MAMESKETVHEVKKHCEPLDDNSQISNLNVGEPSTVKCEWQPGDLLWARVGRHPFWPCVVVVDPQNGKFFQLKRTGRSSQRHFHVQFFGDNGSRSWVSATQTLKYTGKNNLFKVTESKKKDKRHSSTFLQTGKNLKWDCAVQEAEEAASKSRNERIQFFEEYYPINADDSANRAKSVEPMEKANKSSSQKRPLAEDKTQQQIEGSLERGKKNSAQEQNIPNKRRKGDLQKGVSSEENVNLDTKNPPHKKMKRRKPKKKPGKFEVFVDRCAHLFAMDSPDLQADEAKCRRFMQAMWSSMTEEEKSRYHGSYEEISVTSEL